jgi:TPP-dependent indolepyruvate ferredoxin oxidoreductase alpha subunit
MMAQTFSAKSTVAWVDDDLCTACYRCDARRACTIKALLQIDPYEPPFVDTHRCMGCFDCVEACPNEAIKPLNTNGAA